MSSKLNPYLTFDGNAKEALEFYQTALGGKLEMTPFKDGGMPHDPSLADKIMHGVLTTESGMTLMASDNGSGMPFVHGNDMTLSLVGEDETELRGYWDKLSDDAKITMALEKAPWGDTFGMLNDKFGIAWMVNISGKPANS